jgi:general secretion pathway protein A
MLYYQYFRLKGPPFEAASPEGAVYFSPTHLEGLATLESGLSGELTGLTLLTGEVGTGKTTLIYSLLQRDYKRVRIAHIDDPKLSFLEIMRSILNQLNLYSTGSTKLDYLEALDRFLKLRGKEERIAVIVDESQVLSDEILEELRLLSGHGQHEDRGLQLILVGQPELADRLKKPELRQLNQRIASRGVLKPLSHAQAMNYVECRLIAQGGKSSAIFASGALRRLLRRSDGIPRKINVLCRNAMVASFYAGERKVSAKTAKKIAEQYHDAVKIDHGFSLRSKPALAMGSVLALLIVLFFGRPESWPHWIHSVAFGDASAKTSAPVLPVDQPKKTAPVKASNAKPKIAAAVAHPIKSATSVDPAVAPSSAPKTKIIEATKAPKANTSATAPAAVAAANVAPQKQAVASASPEKRNQITVRYGDTLEKIAVRYLGSKDKINELIDANPQLTNINELTVGQIIHLPPGVTPKASPDQTATATTQPVSNAEDPAGH